MHTHTQSNDPLHLVTIPQMCDGVKNAKKKKHNYLGLRCCLYREENRGLLQAANLSQGGLMLTYAESDFVCVRQTGVTNKINSH